MTTEELQGLDAYADFVSLLREMFELEHADLDFGMYRIMKTRGDAIRSYFADDLPRHMVESLEGLAAQSRAQAEEAYEVAREKLAVMGILETVVDENGELRESLPPFSGEAARAISTLRDAMTALAVEDVGESDVREILRLLVEFFRRFYHNGDFIPAPDLGRRDAYGMPYAGEDPYFYWATRGMHYVKTDEFFRNYAFDVPLEGTGPASVRVQFNVCDVEVVGENEKEKRLLFPVVDSVALEEPTHRLVVDFEYRKPVSGQDKRKQSGVFGDTEEALLDAVQYPPLREALAATEGRGTLLRRRLDHFAAIGTRDFFVHTDLHGFLTSQLDFYIKTQVLHWEDVDGNFPRRRAVMRALKSSAEQVIAFLAQLENLQKRLFEKKRLVIATDYMLHVRFLPEQMRSDVVANEVQLAEWREHFGLEGAVTEDTLAKYPTLPLNTQHFGEEFKRQLLVGLSHVFPSGIGEAIDGLLVKAENYGGLRTLREVLKDNVKAIYIDPPYNTGSDGFLYPDHYIHGTWLSMMEGRLGLARDLLMTDAPICISIDENEVHNLRQLTEAIFETHIATIAVQNNPRGRTLNENIATSHEYLLLAAANPKARIGGIPKSDEQIAKEYREVDDDGRRYRPIELRNTHREYNRETRSNLWYPLYVNAATGEVSVDCVPGAIKVEPLWPDGFEGCWTWETDKARRDIHLLLGREVEGQMKVFRKDFAEDEAGEVATKKPKSLWLEPEVQTDKGRSAVEAVIGPIEQRLGFRMWAKPPGLIEKAIQLSPHSEGYVLDFFAGSGTTAEAVMRLSRGGTRQRFALVEMGRHFETLLVPRVQKLLFAPEWQDQQPVEMPQFDDVDDLPDWVEKSPRIVKLLTLESYDDALANLQPQRLERERAIGGGQVLFLKHFGEVLLDGNAAMLRPSEDGETVDVEWLNPDELRINVQKVGGVEETPVDLLETSILWLGLHPQRYEEVEQDGRLYRFIYATKGDEPTAVVLRSLVDLDESADREFLEEKLNGASCFINGGAPLPGAHRLETALTAAMEEGQR